MKILLVDVTQYVKTWQIKCWQQEGHLVTNKFCTNYPLMGTWLTHCSLEKCRINCRIILSLCYCVCCTEAERSQSQPTADLNTGCYQLVTNSHPSHSSSLSISNGPRPASASAPPMSSSLHEAVTEQLAFSKSSLDARRDAIRQQMVELNRQRLLAQAKVDELRQQEQQFATQQVPAVFVMCIDSRMNSQPCKIFLKFYFVVDMSILLLSMSA